MFKKPYLPAFLWLLAVTELSVMPGVPLPKFDLFSTDKLGHAAAYALLAWLIFRGFRAANGRNASWKEGLVICSIATGYGILMEFVQGAFFPNRFFEVDDMLANAFGAVMVYLVVRKKG